MLRIPLFALALTCAFPALAQETPQPRWTTAPRFLLTPTWVIPENTAQLRTSIDAWTSPQNNSAAGFDARFDAQYGAAFGLPGRFELDVALLTAQAHFISPLELRSEALAVRWALGEWNRFFANPALRLIFQRLDGLSPRAQIDAEFAGELGDASEWGASVGLQRELRGSSLEQVYHASGALGTTLSNDDWRGALEARIDLRDHSGGRGSFDLITLLAGPGVTWKPKDHATLLLAFFAGWERSDDTGITTSRFYLQPMAMFNWTL